MTRRMDNRGVSIAVTHVLTIGITTILIGGLILGAGGLLEGEQDRAADRELQSIGESLATEIVTATANAEDRGLDETTVTTNHPLSVTSQGYTVELTTVESEVDGVCAVGDRLADEEYDACIVLSGNTVDKEVPLNLPTNVEVDDSESNRASGGSIVITVEEDGNGDYLVWIGGN